MSSMLDHEALVSTTRVDSDAVILEFVPQLRSEGASESHISQHPGPVRHFLTWLELHGIAVEAINGAVIEQFLRHDCDCCIGVPTPVRFRPWRKRRSSPKIMKDLRGGDTGHEGAGTRQNNTSDRQNRPLPSQRPAA